MTDERYIDGPPGYGEVWMEADGCLLVSIGELGWVAFGRESILEEDDPGIAFPLRRVFDVDGNYVGSQTEVINCAHN